MKKLLLFNTPVSLARLQRLVWALVFFIVFFALLPNDGFWEALLLSILNTVFYATIIYGNINFLFPRFYQKGRYGQYILYAFVFVTVAALGRGFLANSAYNHFIADKPEIVTIQTMLSFVIGALLNFLLSFIFRIALAYFELKQNAGEILRQKSEAELKLLKSQVQPHFLFNTLNNIYYEAFREAPLTALLIERLSEIMRYFVDESPKEHVLLATEIQFLENYIALERIRIPQELEIQFYNHCDPALCIPPMLLITFVENIFKHGINRLTPENKIELSLPQHGAYLVFQTCNKVQAHAVAVPGNSFGLRNLRQRLHLLYNNDFELHARESRLNFIATLKIPISKSKPRSVQHRHCTTGMVLYPEIEPEQP